MPQRRVITSPTKRLSQAASILSAFTVASWYVDTLVLAEMPSQVSPETTV